MALGNMLGVGASSDYWSAVASAKLFNGADVLSAYAFALGTGINSSDGPHRRLYGFPLR